MPGVGSFLAGVWQGITGAFSYGGGAGAAAGGSGAAAGGAAGFGATVGGFIGNALIAAGVSYGISSVMPGMGSSDRAMASALDNTIDSMPPKKFIYGQCRVGGTLVYAKALQNYTSATYGATDSKKNQVLHMVFEIAGHPCEAIDTIWFKDTNLNIAQATVAPENDLFPNNGASWGVDSSGVTRYAPSGTAYDKYMMFKIYTGSQLAADRDLRDAMIANGVTDWTAAMIGTGKTYVYMRCGHKPKLFQGIPKLSFYVRGKNDIYDPRDASTGYTENSVLCIRDYMVESKLHGGFGEDIANINDTVAAASANVCDELIDVFDTGSQQKRYFLGGVFNSAQQPQQIINDMLATCAGWMEQIDGKWWISAGEYTAPTMTLTDSELCDYPSWQLNRSDKEAVNSIKPIIRSAETAWYPSNVKSVEALRKVWGSTAGNTFTSSGDHGLVVGDRIKFEWWQGSAVQNQYMTGDINPEVFYYVATVPTSTTFTVSATAGGAEVAMGTSSGEMTGLHDVYLSKDTERKSTEMVLAMANDETLGRRLGIIKLRQARQEMTGVIPCKPGTAFACPFDLVVGESFRLIDNHMGFWSRIGSEVGSKTVALNVGESRYEIASTAHGLVTGDPVVLNENGATGLQEDHVYFAITYSTDLFGLSEYRGGPNVIEAAGTIDYQEVQGKEFRVSGWEMSLDDWTPKVLLGVRETASNVYDWTNDREVDPDDAPGISTNDIANVEEPQNFTVETGTDALYLQADGTIISRARLTWDLAEDAYIIESGHVQIQYRLVGSGAAGWVSVADFPGASTEAYVIGPEDGAFYDWQIRFRNSFGFNSDWVQELAVEMVGKTAPPANVTDAAFDTYDPQRITAKLTWTDPTDLDLAHVEIYYDVDTGSGYSGTLTFAGAVLPGIEEFTQERVYSQGVASDWKWVIKTVDTTGNVSTDEPWPEVIETIDPIPGVTDFVATARTAANGGLQINATWTDDLVDCDVATQHWRKDVDGDHIGAEPKRTAMSKGAVDINIPYADLDVSAGAFIATDYWIRAWRVFLVNGQEVWSDAISQEVTVQPDQKAPARPTAIDIEAYDITKKSTMLSWSDPADEDLMQIDIYRKQASATTKQTFLADDLIGSALPGAQHWHDFGLFASGTSYYFHYGLRAVDKFGNQSTLLLTRGSDWDYITVQAAAAPTITSITARSEGNGIEIVWPANAAYAEDAMFIEWWVDGDEDTLTSDRVPYKEGTNYGTIIFLPPGSAGNYRVRIQRVSRWNKQDIYTLPYTHGSTITVTEDTVAPATPTGLTATPNYADKVVRVSWNPNTEADIQEYHLWRDVKVGGAWQGYVKVANIPASQNPDDNPSYEDPTPWQREAAGTDYRYDLKAIDRSGNDSAAATSSTITMNDVTAPSAPTGFSYSWRQQGAFLQFTVPLDQDFDHVEISRKQGAGGSYSVIGESVSGLFFDTGTGPNTDAHEAMDDFYYRIRAFDRTGNASGYVANDGDAGLPLAPTALSDLAFAAATKTAGTIILPVDWTAPTGSKWVILQFTSDAATGVQHETWVKASHERYQSPLLQSTAGDVWTVRGYVVDYWGNISAADTDTETH